MTVEAEELQTEETALPAKSGYPTGATTGGEVSAMTLIEDVRAIRQRLDGIEVALRQLGTQMEAWPAVGSGDAPAIAPVGSLDELRKALLGDLQADLRKSAKGIKILMGVILLMTLSGLGGIAWMLHQLE